MRNVKSAILIALVLGLAFSGVQIYLDYRSQVDQVTERTRQAVALVQTSATQAVWELDKNLADRVALGLCEYRPIVGAKLRTEFGSQLSVRTRTRSEGPLRWLSDKLFSAKIEQSFPLHATGPDKKKRLAGHLDIEIDPYENASEFFLRAETTILSGVIKNLFLAFLLVMLFQSTLTKPLRHIVGGIAMIDPDNPGKVRLSTPPGHPDDELAMLTRNTNDMLRAINERMDEREFADASRASAEARLTEAVATLPEGILLFNENDFLMLFNEQVSRIFPQAGPRLSHGLRFDDFLELVDQEPIILTPTNERRTGLSKFSVGNDQDLAPLEWRLEYGRWIKILGHRRPDVGLFLIISEVTAQKQHTETLEKHVQERTSELLEVNEQLKRGLEDRASAERHAQQARLEAVRANEAKSTFLSNMSHELRTPLNAIIGFSQALDMMPEEKARIQSKEYMGIIHNAGLHLVELINQLLDLSQIEAGNLELHLEPVSSDAAVREAIDLVQMLADSRGITIRNKMDSKASPDIWADPLRLRQVLLNLLTNAINYNREGGQVVINCEIEHEDAELQRAFLRINIEDTGSGIPESKREKIFEPFYRLDSNDKKISGTGIGLALSLQLALLMKSRLDFESTPGKGTCFWIKIPTITGKERPISRT